VGAGSGDLITDFSSGALIPEPGDLAGESWEVAAVLGGADTQRVGTFQYLIAEKQWFWSDAVARMHGYAPGEVTPTTDLMLSHKHPDDRAKVAEILHRVEFGGPFSSRHRIIDTYGKTRWVVVVGDRMVSETGEAIGTQGFYVDVTDSLQADVTTMIAGVVESRAVIEQAKGVLMMAYGIDAERAFDILKWRSQATQVKLKTVAAQFLEAVMGHGLPAGTLSVIDHLITGTNMAAPSTAENRPASAADARGDI
jgi:PAS domain S-box-containing protein